MPGGQRHLTHGDGCRIGALKKSGLSNGVIAARPGRDRSSVWRELRRNGGDSGYSPGEGRGRAEARRSGASSVPRKMTAERWAHVETSLTEGWSPERIAGASGGGWAVGRQCIYEHLKADRKAGGGLFPLLRRRGRNRTGGVAGTRAGATSRAGWTSLGGRMRWRGRGVWATGRRTRSSGKATAGGGLPCGPRPGIHVSTEG